MHLVPKSEHSSPWIEDPSSPRRLRPGERPVWVDLRPDARCLAHWRSVAAQNRLPVEVVLAVALEHGLVSKDLEQSGVSATELDRIAERELAQPRLAPTAELRAWLAQLTGSADRAATAADDELPEAALPERLVQRAGRPGQLLELVSNTEKLERGLLWERAATLQGLCLSEWALRAALRLAAYARLA